MIVDDLIHDQHWVDWSLILLLFLVFTLSCRGLSIILGRLGSGVSLTIVLSLLLLFLLCFFLLLWSHNLLRNILERSLNQKWFAENCLKLGNLGNL